MYSPCHGKNIVAETVNIVQLTLTHLHHFERPPINGAHTRIPTTAGMRFSSYVEDIEKAKFGTIRIILLIEIDSEYELFFLVKEHHLYHMVAENT